MRKPLILVCLLGLASCPTLGRAADDYKLGPDSQYHEGVPRGEASHYTFESKGVFPGTIRDYWIYVPKQYDSSKAACVMVFQDGSGFQDSNGGFRVPVVFDNLIYKKEMPVTIAIMINPGVVPAESPNALPRFNRSYEYDDPTDKYDRFLLEEILPEIGKRYNLSGSANDRALCGASSGGICSFTAAWQRPEAFSRVISFIGSFTNLRGGHIYPSLIRKMEPKPIRVFLQDGSNDQDIYSGSWFIGNQDVAAALKFGRYDYQFVIGHGTHSGNHGAAILPDALRWLWRDYPAPIKPASVTPQPVMEALIGGEGWQLFPGVAQAGPSLAVDASGAVYFGDGVQGDIVKVEGARIAAKYREGAGATGALAFGPDGKLYSMRRGRDLTATDGKGRESVYSKDVCAAAMTIDRKGNVYYADSRDGSIWVLDSKRARRKLDAGVSDAGGVALTPDQSLLIVTQRNPGKSAISYHIRPDGTLADRQLFFDLDIPYGQGASGAAGITTDTEGRLYVASDAGIQICDQAGRVTGMIANPEHSPTTSVAFGGPKLDTLFAVCRGRLYTRKTRVKGALSFQEPLKPPAPRL